MSVTIVRYERLYNTGNYENVKFCAEVIVENGEDPAAAFAEANTAVHAAYVQWQADCEAEAKRQQEEYEAERKRRQEQRDAERAAAQKAVEDPGF